MALVPSVDLAGAFEAVGGALKVGGGGLEGGRLEDGRLRCIGSGLVLYNRNEWLSNTDSNYRFSSSHHLAMLYQGSMGDMWGPGINQLVP